MEKSKVNIKGAPIGTLLCYIMIMSISMYFLVKNSGVRLDYATAFAKPALSAILCGVSARIAYWILTPLISEKLATVCGIAVGGIVYLSALVLLRAISEDDIKKLPKGEKLAKLYSK